MAACHRSAHGPLHIEGNITKYARIHALQERKQMGPDASEWQGAAAGYALHTPGPGDAICCCFSNRIFVRSVTWGRSHLHAALDGHELESGITLHAG